MFRVIFTVALAAILLPADPRVSNGRFALTSPAIAEEARAGGGELLVGAGVAVVSGLLQGWLSGLGPRLGDFVAPPSVDGCNLLIFCRRTFSGFSRFTRQVFRAPVRLVTTTQRATTRVARRTVRMTTRLASRTIRTTARVAGGTAALVFTGTAGAIGAVTGIKIPPRRRGQAEFAVRGMRPGALRRLESRGYLVVESRSSTLLRDQVIRLRAPDGISRSDARRAVVAEDPGTTIADNDLFRRPTPGLYRSAGRTCGKRCENFDITEWSRPASTCSAGVRIGVVDTGVDIHHAAIADSKLTLMTARSADLPESDMDHGTAVVSLLVGQPNSGVVGLVPEAHVFAADAFHGKGPNAGADVYDLIVALDWLADEGVSVINMSLSGPENPLLREAIVRLQDRGITLVAASGQPGRSKEAIGFPGKYDGVITVSAIDSRLRPSKLAMRGDHIAFSAPGVGITVAQADGKIGRVDGTSFAAPFLTAAYAMGAQHFDRPEAVTERLAATARDLGAPGRDPVFGWGIVQYSALPDCR